VLNEQGLFVLVMKNSDVLSDRSFELPFCRLRRFDFTRAKFLRVLTGNSQIHVHG
jgi:hypothetical protein